MGNTSIEWCGAVWNPIRGCSMAKGSETGGCLNCYAARMAARNLPELKSPTTGESFARILQSGPRWTGKVELIESQLALPLKWRKGKRIFVNSMSDLFHESLPDEQIDRVFAVMAFAQAHGHSFQVLTKRAERMRSYVSDPHARFRIGKLLTSEHGLGEFPEGIIWPIRGVWLGVSVENQATADARIPLLLQTPAAIRFVSYEPALSEINFRWAGWDSWKPHPRRKTQMPDVTRDGKITAGCVDHFDGLRMLDWLIIGGESGPGARPFDIAWARNTIAQCREAGVACFVKQLGANVRGESGQVGWSGVFKDRKGADMSEWSEDLRVRQFPGAI